MKRILAVTMMAATFTGLAATASPGEESGMLEINFSVYHATDASKCKDVRLSFMADSRSVTPQQCVMFGQHEMAKWLEGNPNWRIQRWRCGRPHQMAKA